MKVFSMINAKGKTIRLREEENELMIDADGRYFTLPLAGACDLVSVSVTENMILSVTNSAGLSAYSYAGQLLFTLKGLLGEETAKIVSATVMNPFEALGFLSRVKGAPLAKETTHFYCTCEDGSAYLIDLSDGTVVYRK